MSIRTNWGTSSLLLLVAIAALLVRIPLLTSYAPVLYPDTGTYLQAARDLVSGDFSVGLARRTPGYPLLLALAGLNLKWILLAQLLSGVMTAILLSWTALRLSGNRRLAIVAGLAHALSLQQLFQEGAVLTEAWSTFSLAATLAFLVFLSGRTEVRKVWFGLFVLGLLCAYTLLIRPQFICLVAIAPVALSWAYSRGGSTMKLSFGAGALVLTAAVSLVIGWCAMVQAKTGYFTLSTQSGFGMVNHPIDYIELASDRYSTARDILVQVRDRRVAEVGHSRNTIWFAWPEIQRATGWSLPEASRQFQGMCKELFMAYPGRYARSVASAWVDFWTVPFFWAPEQVSPPALRSGLEGLWWVQHKLLRLANLAFVLLVAAAVVVPAVRRRLRWDLGLTAISATVLMSSLIQAMADQGASSRYHLPTQSLVVLVLVVALARWRRA